MGVPKINPDDIPPGWSHNKSDWVRSEAIKVLAVISNFTPSQRARILNHASKINEI